VKLARGHYWIKWEIGNPPAGLTLCVEPERWGYVQLLKRWGFYLTTSSGTHGYRRRAFYVGPLLFVFWRKH
jgi:hypothetical protein